MKIAASDIALSASHVAVQHSRQQEQLRYWEEGREPVERNGEQAPGGLRRLALSLEAERRSVEVRISGQAAALQPRKVLLETDEEDPEQEPMAELEVSILKRLVEHMTGRAIRVFRPSDLEPPAQVEAPEADRGPRQAEGEGEGAERAGWGLVYDYYESHYEAESTSFRAEGVVRTADGREIAISAELHMSREFFSEERLSLRAGDALKDPLVINFSGTAAQLTQDRFRFDLDRDGREEQIAFVGPGSGFLALDRNGNGTIDDGGELFGPTGGDGFAELAALDADANGWIDENDTLYAQLRIWSRDAQGNDQLVGLGQRGVGAIYLGHTDTPFQLKDADNELQGQVRSTGLFLGEEGGAGTVQQVDLKV